MFFAFWHTEILSGVGRVLRRPYCNFVRGAQRRPFSTPGSLNSSLASALDLFPKSIVYQTHRGHRSIFILSFEIPPTVRSRVEVAGRLASHANCFALWIPPYLHLDVQVVANGPWAEESPEGWFSWTWLPASVIWFTFWKAFRPALPGSTVL